MVPLIPHLLRLPREQQLKLGIKYYIQIEDYGCKIWLPLTSLAPTIQTQVRTTREERERDLEWGCWEGMEGRDVLQGKQYHKVPFLLCFKASGSCINVGEKTTKIPDLKNDTDNLNKKCHEGIITNLWKHHLPTYYRNKY